MKEKSTLLKLSRVSFAYESKEVLKNISFSLLEKERLGIIGSSGSGKSTLLKLLDARYIPDKGSLIFRGRDYSLDRNDRLMNHPMVSLMAQDFDLDPNLSADENIQKAGRHLSPSAQKTYLGKVHRAFQMRSFKGNKVQHLSGGQKQRVALACALIGQSELLLLDEPFSQLDYQLKQLMLSFLEEEPISKGIIIVGHEPSDLMRFCDRLAVLDQGKLLQIGTVAEIYHYPKNERVGQLSGIINSLSLDELEETGLEHALFRPQHCRLKKGGPWQLEALSYQAFGQLGLLRHPKGAVIRALISMEGDYSKGSTWHLSIKKP